jgi:hypothetical protein
MEAQIGLKEDDMECNNEPSTPLMRKSQMFFAEPNENRISFFRDSMAPGGTDRTNFTTN